MRTTSGVSPSIQCNTSASLAAMLEKEMSCYRRCPPNKVVPLPEYIQHRRLLIEWCNIVVDLGNFRAPNELVQVVSGSYTCMMSVLPTSVDLSSKLNPKAMALADKYMSIPGLYSYMKAHYQLVVVTCLSIAIKIDSPSLVTCQELSELLRGEHTREEIESEEICILQALAWYVNPPTATQIANHILALNKNLKCAEWDREVLVDRVHRLLKASVLDLGLSTQLRPSTLALASILASTESLRDPQYRQAVLHSILSIMNKFDFASPAEIDTIRTDLTFLERSNTSTNALRQHPQQAHIAQPANVLNESNSVSGSNVPPNPSSQVAEDILSSNL